MSLKEVIFEEWDIVLGVSSLILVLSSLFMNDSFQSRFFLGAGSGMILPVIIHFIFRSGYWV